MLEASVAGGRRRRTAGLDQVPPGGASSEGKAQPSLTSWNWTTVHGHRLKEAGPAADLRPHAVWVQGQQTLPLGHLFTPTHLTSQVLSQHPHAVVSTLLEGACRVASSNPLALSLSSSVGHAQRAALGSLTCPSTSFPRCRLGAALAQLSPRLLLRGLSQLRL